MTQRAEAAPAPGTVLVRYWAAARAAAGVDSDTVPAPEPLALSRVLAEVMALHSDRPRLKDVVGVCSILIGEQPVGARDLDEVLVRAGDTVELLPPFAGG